MVEAVTHLCDDDEVSDGVIAFLIERRQYHTSLLALKRFQKHLELCDMNIFIWLERW